MDRIWLNAYAQEPSPADIRPLPVLKQTLSLLKRKWKENHNYPYALDQFKSMRQDLTVSGWRPGTVMPAHTRSNESRTNSLSRCTRYMLGLRWKP